MGIKMHRKQGGMSLVEVLVGILIGMIGIVVIFQVLATAEERKRTTSSGSDAQVAAAIALFTMERDLRLAGHGFSLAEAYQGCTVNAFDTARPGNNFTFPLAALQITQGAGGASDTITALYGNSSIFAGEQTFSASTATTKRAQSRGGFLRGELVLIAGSGPVCALVEITDDTNADGVTLDHAAGAYTNAAGAAAVARYNPAGGPPVAFTAGHLYSFGPSPARSIWAINNNALTVTNDLRFTDVDGDAANDLTVIADAVINLQADYGVDANNDNMISPAEWTTANPADWTKVRAIRVALLTRSSQYERAKVTTVAPSWAGGAFVMTNVDGTADTDPPDANNWRNYRYRVYETTIPLRNIIWGTAP